MSDAEPVRREPARRLDELTPRELAGAVLFQSQFHAAHCSRYTGGAIPDERTAFAFDQFAVLVEVNVAMRRRRRHLAIIDCGRSTVPQTNHHKAAAAKVAGSRMRHCERKRDRD